MARTSILGRRAERATTELASAAYELGKLIEAAAHGPATRGQIDALERLVAARELARRAYAAATQAAAELDELAATSSRAEA